MASDCIEGNLWEFNLTKVIVVDVTLDYHTLQPPLSSSAYPVLAEIWVPTYRLGSKLSAQRWIEGFLYDWHESPALSSEPWYIGVVKANAMPLGFN